MKFLCDICKAKYQIADDKVAGKTVRMKCRRCGHVVEISAAQVDAAVTESSVARKMPVDPLGAGRAEEAKPMGSGAFDVTDEETQVMPPERPVPPAAVSQPFSLSTPRAPGAGLGSSTPRPATPPARPALGLVPRNPPTTPVAPLGSPPGLRPAPRPLGAPRPLSKPLGSPLGAPRPLSPPGATRSSTSSLAAVRPGAAPAPAAGVAPSSATSEPAEPALAATPSLDEALSRSVAETPAPLPTHTAGAMAENWYVGVAGVPLGPIRLSVIREKAAAGAVDGDSLVWREGFDEWVALRNFPELMEVVEEARAAAARKPATLTAPSPQRSMTPQPMAAFGAGPATPPSFTAPSPAAPAMAGVAPADPFAPPAPGHALAGAHAAPAPAAHAPHAGHLAKAAAAPGTLGAAPAAAPPAAAPMGPPAEPHTSPSSAPATAPSPAPFAPIAAAGWTGGAFGGAPGAAPMDTPVPSAGVAALALSTPEALASGSRAGPGAELVAPSAPPTSAAPAVAAPVAAPHVVSPAVAPAISPAVAPPSVDSPPVRERPQRAPLHPLAYAVIAMAAAFGGVAAFVLLTRPEAPPPPAPVATAATAVAVVDPGAAAVPPPPAIEEPVAAPSAVADTAPVAGGPTGVRPSGAPTAAPKGSTAAAPIDTSGFASSGIAGPTSTPDPTGGGSNLPSTLSEGEIRGVVSSNTASVRRKCWEPALDAAGPSGKKTARVNASITIAPSGAVKSAAASGGNDFPGLADCIAQRIRGWKFPAAGGETSTAVPFVFASQ